MDRTKPKINRRSNKLPLRIGRLGGLRQADEVMLPKSIDFAVLLTVITLLCFGLIMLFSASMSDALADRGNTWHYVLRQVIFTVVGLLAMWLLTASRSTVSSAGFRSS